MSLAPDSITIPDAPSGLEHAGKNASSKYHPCVLLVDANGHLVGTTPTYWYATPAVAVGASKLYFDLFNASGSGKIVHVRGVWIVPKLDVAATVLVGVRIDLYRTSAVGTGGTAAPYRSATPDVAGGNINPASTSNAALPAQVTARWLPTGGATIDDWLLPSYMSPEESPTSMGYLVQYQNLILSSVGMFAQTSVELAEGQGLLAKQGTVAGVGSLGFIVAFTVEP